MKGKLWQALALSVALHALLWLHSAPIPEATTTRAPPYLVEIAPPQRRGSGSSGRRTPRRSPGPSLAQLGIGWTGKGIPLGTDSQGVGAAAGSAVLETLRRAVPLEHIRQQVDCALDYPLPFRQRAIEGTVTAEVIFASSGAMEKRTARSQSRYLRVHILRVLRQALAEGLPASYTHGESLLVRFRFDFLLSDRAQLGNALVHGSKSEFHFQRIGRPFGQWKLGPLTGVWMVPAVAIDPGWLVEKAEQVFSRKAEIDPLDVYRRETEF